ncbi:MAG: KAP family NTPase [Sphingomonadales bacterium]|nr:KAP family NTPase [Sphingomonadales bacterium]
MANWEDDKLNRRECAEFLTNYLVGQSRSSYTAGKGSFVLNIDSEWGFGKTYFLREWLEDLRRQRHPSVYFDAWANDFSDQPFLAFIQETEGQLSSHLSRSPQAKELLKKTTSFARQVSKQIAPAIMAYAVQKVGNESILRAIEAIESSDDEAESEGGSPDDDEELAKEISGEVSELVSRATKSYLSRHKAQKHSIKLFNKNLQKLTRKIDSLKSASLPIFILIDELDRCRPLFALELLETIKHVFINPNVVFVIATDSTQLAHAVSGRYGANFDGRRYLRRFFDQTYRFPEPDRFDFAAFLIEAYNIERGRLFTPIAANDARSDDSIVYTLELVFRFFGLSLRDQQQCMNLLEAIMTAQSHRQSWHLYFLAALIAMMQRFPEFFEQAVDRGADSQFWLQTPGLQVDKDILHGDTKIDPNSQFNRSPSKMTVREVLRTYFEFSNKNLNQIANDFTSNSSSLLNIKDALLQECQGIPRPAAGVYSDISNYPAYVRQAGQLING